jgi:hypothetical protein
MPTKRRAITRVMTPQIDDDQLLFLSDGLLGKDSGKRLWLYTMSDKQKLWLENKESILPAWICANPGTRPSFWWLHDAPRITPESISRLGRGEGWVTPRTSEYAEPRQRLGGTGTPHHECLNYVPRFHCGIPDSWVSQWEEDYYNGRKMDIHGDPIGMEYTEGHFLGVAIDPEDPPRFESQASYLKRHGLLEPGEERRLKAKDFEPETIAIENEKYSYEF